MAERIEGTRIAERIMKDAAERRARLDIEPGLGVVLIGDDPASRLYVNLKEKACAKAGIAFRKVLLPADISEEDVITAVRTLNGRDDIHAILIQLPLPEHLDEDRIIAAMDPRKDVDGFHPATIDALMRGEPTIIPGLAAGILEMVRSVGAPIAGKNALVIANSEVFFGPVAKVLSDDGMHVAYASPDDGNIGDRICEADVIVIAVGRPGFLRGDCVKAGAIVIDVGTNRVDGKLKGDLEDTVWDVAGHVTPVPGGVGPVTVAMLIWNTVELASRNRETDGKAGN